MTLHRLPHRSVCAPAMIYTDKYSKHRSQTPSREVRHLHTPHSHPASHQATLNSTPITGTNPSLSSWNPHDLHRQIQQTHSLQIPPPARTRGTPQPVPGYPPTQELQTTHPATNSQTGKTPDGITPVISSNPHWPAAAPSEHNTRGTTPRRRTCKHSRIDFLTTPRSSADTPPGRALARRSQQFTQSAQPPPRPRPESEHMAHGAAGESACARGAGTPRLPPPPRHPASHSALRLPGGPPPPWGGGSGRKKTHVSVPGQEKVWFPPPFPRRSALADSSGRGAGRACALGFVLRTRPGGGGEGAGLPPPHRPPPTSPAPRLHVGRPLPRGRRASPPLEGGSAPTRPARRTRRAQTFFGSPAPRAPLPWPARE